MADLLHTNLSKSSIFTLFSPLNLSPHSNFSFASFAPLRRRFSHSSVVTKLCSDSSKFDIISTTELSDGSVSFKFGDASEVSRNLDEFNGGIEVELETESEGSLEANAVAINGESDGDKIAEDFDRNSVELKETAKENADNVVELISDAQFSESSVEDELNYGLISAGGVQNLSDFDTGKYENQGGNGAVTMFDSSAVVVIGEDEELSDASKKKSDDDELEHGGDVSSDVGGTSLDVEASVVVETLKDEIVKDGIVTGDIVEDKIVSLKDVETMEGEILKADNKEDKIVCLKEDEILKVGIVEDEAVSLVKETVKGKDEIVEGEIEEDKANFSVEETVNEKIVEDESEEGKIVSLVDETVKGEIVKDEIEEGKVVSLVEETVNGDIVKDKIVEDEIQEGKVVSLVEETINGDIVKDKTVEDEIDEGKVVSLVEETDNVDIVKAEIVEDEIEEGKIVSLVDETIKGDIIVKNNIVEDKVVSLVDGTAKEEIVEDVSEEAKIISLAVETVKGDIVMDDIMENETAKEKVVTLKDEIVNNEIVEDGIVEDEIVKKAAMKDENLEDTTVSLENESDKGCAFIVKHPISMDEDDISVELMSKKLEAELILDEETSSDLQDDVVGLGSILGSNKVHDAITNTVAQSGDDTADNLVAAGLITSEITSPEPNIDSLHEAQLSSPAFSISTAVASLEHSPEALTGGKDAHFVFKNWFGVADGIGQWSLGGVDMGLYAHEFMQNCEKILNSTNARLTDVKQLLQQSAAITQSTGAARVLIAHLDKEVLHVANVGDTGFVIIRNGTVFQKSSPMVHEFSFPYAIGLGDDLVEDAEEYQIDLEDGDVVVTATDGLFDNLYDQEIASMVSKVLEAGMSLQDLAELLATTSAEVGRSESARSPFADAAKAAGHPGYNGGKLDHVTVIVSLVQNRHTCRTAKRQAV